MRFSFRSGFGLAISAVLLMPLAAPVQAAADPALINLAMPGAQILAGIQVRQGLESPFGQFILALLPQNNGMVQFAAATGFDFKHDLREIVIASEISSPSGGRAHGLLIARGSFDTAKFLTLATLTGAKTMNYMGLQIVTPEQGPLPNSFVFLDSSTLVGGPLDLVKGAIERNAAGAALSGPLVQKAADASAANDMWFATVTPVTDLLASSKTLIPANLLGMVLELSGGVHFDAVGATLSSDLLTRSEQDARTLASALKLIVSMVKSNPQALPMRDAQFASDGPVLKLTLAVPESQLEQMVQPASAVRKAEILR